MKRKAIKRAIKRKVKRRVRSKVKSHMRKVPGRAKKIRVAAYMRK